MCDPENESSYEVNDLYDLLQSLYNGRDSDVSFNCYTVVQQRVRIHSVQCQSNANQTENDQYHQSCN